LPQYIDWENVNWDNAVFPYLNVGFSGDETNGFYRHHYGADSFVEYIFDIDVANLHEYTLLISYFGYQQIHLNWTVTFDTDDHYRQLEKIADVNIQFGEHTISQVNINPFGLLLTGVRGSDRASLDTMPVYVHTTEGIVTPNLQWGFNYLGDPFQRASGSPRSYQPLNPTDTTSEPVSGRFFFDQMIDLENVLAVEINGQRVVFK